jgi:hypothetical protein
VKLDVFSLDGYRYQANVKSIPIVVRISSIDTIEIADKIDLREILLLQGGEGVFGGYIRCRLGLEKGILTISADKPHHILYDICDYEDNDFYPGKYDVSIKLQVYRYEHEKRVETISLETTCQLTIN